MQRIGIDQQFADIYQGIGNLWRVLIPSPIISEAILTPELPILDQSVFSRHIFREDDFDLVTRVRRGRFYERANVSQPSQSRALPNPAGEYFNATKKGDGTFEKWLYIYDQFQLPANFQPPKFVALGSAKSLWQVVSRPEQISTGEFLFVLKARGAFGILPEIDTNAIPEKGRAKAIETLGKLTDAAHRELPGSIIDRAGDAAHWCLATWAASKFNDHSLVTKTLDDLIKAIRKKSPLIATDAANITRILHARGKPNAEERRGTRPLMEDDAELALRAVGFLIREFGWAKDS